MNPRLFLTTLSSIALLAAAPATALEIRQSDSVCIVGNTFGEQLQFSGYFEALLHARHPDREVSVYNLSWSADTLSLKPRPQNSPTQDQLLSRYKAGVILACFGLNESYETPLPEFRSQLEAFIDHTLAQRYDGSSAPRLVVISPVAHEQLDAPGLPVARKRNEVLEKYVAVMDEVCRARKVEFANLFHPLLEQYQKEPKRKLTSNGVHLNEDGERFVSSELDALLFGSTRGFAAKWTQERMELLRQAVLEKNRQFWLRHRPLNPFYIYGGRTRPFGEASFPPEMAKLDGMVANRHRRIWDIAQGKSNDLAIDDANLPPLPDYPSTLKEGGTILPPAEAVTRFTMLEGFEVSLFASEEQFPEVANPVQITFDAQGRLWLTTIPSFPHLLPGSRPDDKILVLEDKDADGRADACRTFADGLYMPLGIELGYGGAYVSAPPNLLYLRDRDGDGKADYTRTVLRGFGTEDSHHAISAFCWGPGGGLHMMEGTFLHSQVETPWGPVRMENAGIWRYEPAIEKLSIHVSYPYANPWGQTWDRWGRNTIADASGGDNHFGNAYSGWLPWPEKHRALNRFTPMEAHLRPTAGCEVVSSRQFPDEFQGWWLLNNNIGFQGTRMFRLIEEGSGIKATEWKDLIRSSDPNFRPVDLEFGPDGALYIVDWYNPIIGHTTYSMRDPQRDKKHGRIWRVTAKGRPAVKPPEIAPAKIPALLELLRTPEDRTRYRVRRELAERDTPAVLAAVEKFTASIPEADPEREHLLLECLWVQQHHQSVSPALLERVLQSRDPRARAAAVQVLRDWHSRISGSAGLLKKAAADEHPAVRLETAVAASFIHSSEGVELLLETAKHPVDYYLDYALKESLRALEPHWKSAIAAGKPPGSGNPEGFAWLLRQCSTAEVVSMPPSAAVHREVLRRSGVTMEQINQAATALAQGGRTTVAVMLEALPDAQGTALAAALAAQDRTALTNAAAILEKHAADNPAEEVRTAAVAALLASNAAEAVWTKAGSDARTFAALCRALPLTPESVRTAAAERIAAFATRLPDPVATAARAGMPASGRYLRIELPRRGTLCLTEVEAWSGGRNIALNGGIASQSSTANGGVASRAIDGGTHGEWGRNTTTHTQENEDHPWWELDLGRVHLIERIAITNRTDYASDTMKMLDGFQLTVLDSERIPVFTWQNKDAGARIEIPVTTDLSTPLQASAIRAWHSVPGQAAAKLGALLPLLSNPGLRDAAITALQDLDLKGVPADQLAMAAKTIQSLIGESPLQHRTGAAFQTHVKFAENLCAAAPEACGPLQSQLAKEKPVPLTLTADAQQLLYTQKEITAPAGSVAVLHFENPGEQPHNAVICKPGSLETVGAAADAMQTDPAGLAKGFVPDTPEVLAKTRLLNRGEKESLVFRVPAEPGDYVIVCTFPGHWRLMHATLKVIP